jgi:hypothetical protein
MHAGMFGHALRFDATVSIRSRTSWTIIISQVFGFSRDEIHFVPDEV